MKIRAYITAYDRPKMLRKIIKHLNDHEIYPRVFEDGVNHAHRGKKGFWKTWDEILKDAKEHEADLYLFMPDDFEDLDIERIISIHNEMRKPYVYNIINDGRHQCWGSFKKQEPVNGHERVGFTDCGFFCDREALSFTNWRMKEILPERWKKYPNMSSGVGQYLTNTFSKYKIPMYKPVKSLAYHGDHESKMHPEERKETPLTSK